MSAIIGYKSDIIFLSDTRFNGREGTICDRLKLGYSVYHNSSKNSRGVAVLISKQVEHEIMDTAADPQENLLLLKLKIRGMEMVIGAVYGPNIDANAPEFFGFLGNTLNNWNNLPYILGGDWNATQSCLPLNENPDVLFMRSLPSLNRSRMVADLCERFDMVDPFRTLHPDVRDFTYNPSGTLRKNRSRIDYFLMSTSISASLESCSVAQGFCSKNFDHKPIFLSFRKKKQRKRPIVHNATVDHALASDIVRLAVHKTTIFSLQGGAGPATEGLLNRELALLDEIESKLNRIIFIKGLSMVAELEQEMVEELRVREEGLMDDWTRAAPIEYLRASRVRYRPTFFLKILFPRLRKHFLAYRLRFIGRKISYAKNG